jgi:hypothetical protein
MLLAFAGPCQTRGCASSKKAQTVLLRWRLPRFAPDIFQLIAGMFDLTPECADIPAQLLNRARNLLSQVPQVTASD